VQHGYKLRLTCSVIKLICGCGWDTIFWRAALNDDICSHALHSNQSPFENRDARMLHMKFFLCYCHIRSIFSGTKSHFKLYISRRLLCCLWSVAQQTQLLLIFVSRSNYIPRISNAMTPRRTRLAAVLDLEPATPYTRRSSTRISQGSTTPSAQSSTRQLAIDANPSSQKGKRKQPPDTSHLAGSSKRITTGRAILGTGKPASDDPPISNPRPKCFRISGLPLSWSENDLFDALHAIDPSLTDQNYRPSLYPACVSSTQTALLNLDPCTELLQQHNHLPVSDSASRGAALLTIDSHFYNLTPLNVPVGEVVAELAVRALEDT
jgi:hypothetical protein